MQLTDKEGAQEVLASSISENRGFEDVIIEHIPKLWRVALQFCRYHHSDAEDLLQDTMLRAFRYKQQLQGADNKFGWLRRTLLNTHLNRVRDNKKWNSREDISLVQEIPSFDPIPTSRLVTDVFRKDLWDDDILKALDELPEMHRTVLLLSDVEGIPLKEISEMTGLSRGTISSHIFRSRKKLSRSLEHYAISGGYVTAEKLIDEQEHDIEEMRKAANMGSI